MWGNGMNVYDAYCRKWSWSVITPLITTMIVLSALMGCGGGSGLGPTEGSKRADRLKDRLVVDWSYYNYGDHNAAIESFEETLQQADQFQDQEGVKSQVKSEAYNGIGWSFFKLHDLRAAKTAFESATQLDRGNPDAWVGLAGVALALQDYRDVVQFSIQALERDPDYESSGRVDDDGRLMSHDLIDVRHVRLMLVEAYFHLGRYNASDRPDPHNAAAQLRLISSNFQFRDTGHLLEKLSEVSIELHESISEEN